MSRKMSSIPTRLAIVVLIFMGIAAGIAAAATSLAEAGSDAVRSLGAADAATKTNVSVALKNREFPLKLRMTMQPCSIADCVDI